MTKREFLDAMGGIDSKLIESTLDDERLENKEISVEEPMVLSQSKRPSIFKYVIGGAAGIALVFGIAIFVRNFNNLTTSLPNETDQSAESSYSSDSTDSSVSSDESSRSESFDDSSADVDYEEMLSNARLRYDNLSDFDLPYVSGDVTCETVLAARAEYEHVDVSELYATDRGLVISVFDHHLNKHYFSVDRDGNELDHAAYEYYLMNDNIPEFDYPEGDAFTFPLIDSGYELRFYQNGKLQKAVKLPSASRSSLSEDKTKYLYINDERDTLTLFDVDAEIDVATRTVESFGLDAPWTIQLVNMLTPKLAAVTLIYVDAPHGFSGEEEVRTFLISLPTLDVVQRLPDGATLRALDDNTFIMTKRDSREIVRAVLENGELIEKERISAISQGSDAAQYYNTGNILLSPNKKVMLIREWDGGDLRCRAFSTDNMQLLWEARLRGEDWLPTGFYTSAAITDDAEFYIFGDSLISKDDKPLYRISAK